LQTPLPSPFADHAGRRADGSPAADVIRARPEGSTSVLPFRPRAEPSVTAADVRPRGWQVALALAAVYLVWGSTYAAIRIALGGFPPFLLGGTRFLVAGSLVLGYALAARHPLPTRRQMVGAAIVGVLLLTVGNGGVVWAEQFVDSGLAAILIATVPLWLVAFDALHERGERLRPSVVVGSVIGLAGVALLMAGGLVLDRGPGFWAGVAALLGAAAAWAFGSIFGRYADKPSSFAIYTGIEMLAGGLALTAVGTLIGEWGRMDPDRLAGAPLWANLYLVFVGSLVGFTAYVWLLRSASPAVVGTYAYVNPVVAVLLGVLFLGERLDAWTIAGSAVILLSVVLTQVARTRRTGRPPAPAPECARPNGARTAEARA
jgi:drug/metabolite transporter (DMT)-like permease